MKKIAGVLMISLSLFACGPTVHRGLVAMKISDEVAHVCVGKNEVQPGDRIVLYRNICNQLAPKDPRIINCNRQKIGGGLITEILNEHYAIASFPPGTGFKEGDMVEADK